MNDIVRVFLGGKTPNAVLREEAEAIKQIGEDRRVYTFDEKEQGGFVTARSTAIPVEEVNPSLRR